MHSGNHVRVSVWNIGRSCRNCYHSDELDTDNANASHAHRSDVTADLNNDSNLCAPCLSNLDPLFRSTPIDVISNAIFYISGLTQWYF